METPSVVEPPVMAKERVSPSASEAERVSVSPDVVVSDEPAISAMEPSVGVERTGASLAALMEMVEVAAEELLFPSLTTQEMVRFTVLGLSEVLL